MRTETFWLPGLGRLVETTYSVAELSDGRGWLVLDYTTVWADELSSEDDGLVLVDSHGPTVRCHVTTHAAAVATMEAIVSSDAQVMRALDAATSASCERSGRPQVGRVNAVNSEQVMAALDAATSGHLGSTMVGV